MPALQPVYQQIVLDKFSDLSKQLDVLGAKMDNLVSRVTALETHAAGVTAARDIQLAEISKDIDAQELRLAKHDEEIKTLREIVQRLEQSNRMLAWFSGIAGGAIVLWLVQAWLATI